MERHSSLESEAFIELNGASVLRTNMQERQFTAVANAIHEFNHKSAGVAVTQMVGVRAYCADLGVSGKA